MAEGFRGRAINYSCVLRSAHSCVRCYRKVRTKVKTQVGGVTAHRLTTGRRMNPGENRATASGVPKAKPPNVTQSVTSVPDRWGWGRWFQTCAERQRYLICSLVPSLGTYAPLCAPLGWQMGIIHGPALFGRLRCALRPCTRGAKWQHWR